MNEWSLSVIAVWLEVSQRNGVAVGMSRSARGGNV